MRITLASIIDGILVFAMVALGTTACGAAGDEDAESASAAESSEGSSLPGSESGSSSSADSGAAQECIEAGSVSYQLELLPAPLNPGSPETSAELPCTVLSVDDAMDELALECDLSGELVSWSMNAPGLAAPLSGTFAVDDEVDLFYATTVTRPRFPTC